MTRKKTKIKVNATGPERDAADAATPENLPVEDAISAPAAVSELTGESEVSALQLQLERAETRAAEYLDGLQRERAEFQNFKRRIERERERASGDERGELGGFLHGVGSIRRAGRSGDYCTRPAGGRGPWPYRPGSRRPGGRESARRFGSTATADRRS